MGLRQVRLPDWLRQSMSLASADWAVAPAVRAVAAAGVIALIGVTTHRLSAVSLMYFGAACAVAFVAVGSLRTRLVALLAQGLGAAAGLGLGAIGASGDVSKVLVAAAVGLLSGMLGSIGRLVTAFALMAVIGVAYEQFGNVPLPWYDQAGWYLAGTLVVSIAAMLPTRGGRLAYERGAVADVYAAVAGLLAAVGTPAAADRRRDLAAASAASRAALDDHRILPARAGARPSRIRTQFRGSQLAALAAASLHSQNHSVPAVAVSALRAAAVSVRRGDPVVLQPFVPDSAATRSLVTALEVAGREEAVDVAPLPGLGGRLRSAFRTATDRAAALAGLRLAWCMALATALTCVLHQASHSYWLPLTVAVVVRPEYASVFVRTVNRVIGSIGGALVAVIALILLPPGGSVAIAAALSIGWAVLSAPKLYGLSVIGITGSALLSASIGTEDPVYPALRLIDTLLGCALALVFGYLLWPGRQTLPFAARPGRAAADAVAYLRQATRPPGKREQWPMVRDQAYVSTHLYRARVTAALADPPPVSVAAAEALPGAVALEDVVDAITALGDAVRRDVLMLQGREVDELAAQIAVRPGDVVAQMGELVNGATRDITPLSAG